MKDFIKYLRRRDLGLVVSEDTKKIISECNEIFFVNTGDWPFWVYRAGSSVKRYVDQYQDISFGDSHPETLETDDFSIEFDTVNVGTVKSCTVERVVYESAATKCLNKPG